MSFAETAGFCSPNYGADVSKWNGWNKVQKHLLQQQPMIVSRRNRIMKIQSVDANSKRKLCVALSSKGSDHFLVYAASAEGLSESEQHSNVVTFIRRQFDVFSRFAKLQVFYGVILGMVVISLLGVEKLSDFTPSLFTGIFQVLTALFPTHVYINGLNQLEDIEIDRINKPDRPLVSGEYSFNTGVILTLSSALMALGVGWIIGSPHLLMFIVMTLMAATAYSLNVPYLRWKNNAYLSTLCVFIAQASFAVAAYFHIQTIAFGRSPLFSKAIIVALAKATFATVVTTIFKDIPDVAGDKIHGVRSLAVQLGKKTVFWICVSLSQIGYLVGILFGLTCSNNWCKIITVTGHLVLSLIMWNRAKSVDVRIKEETLSFYGFLVKFILIEFSLVPLIR